MAVTYGDRMLADAEARRRRMMAKRRAVTLLVPSTVVVAWSTMMLVSTRLDRLGDDGVSGIRVLVDPVLPTAWTVFFVLMPLWWALKPEPLPAGAALAFVAGPVMTPILFGAGGWQAWQIALLAIVTWLVLGGAAARSRRLA